MSLQLARAAIATAESHLTRARVAIADAHRLCLDREADVAASLYAIGKELEAIQSSEDGSRRSLVLCDAALASRQET